MKGHTRPPSGADSADDDDEEDSSFSNSEFLTRKELLRRRSTRLRRLTKCYIDFYWSFMEELRRKVREYYWKYGNPFMEKDGGEGREICGTDDTMNSFKFVNRYGDVVSDTSKLGLGFGKNFKCCVHIGCTSKAMALTGYCFQHILSDTKQMLYTGCKHRFKSTARGINLCGKPILSSTALCPRHLRKVKDAIQQALKRNGVSVSLYRKLASNFHLIINLYVRLIQTRRRATASRYVHSIAMNNGFAISNRSS